MKDYLNANKPNKPTALPYPLPKGKCDDLDMMRDMTLRDWFAGQAMAGFCADQDVNWNPGKNTETVLAKLAYEVADAMMEARKKPE